MATSKQILLDFLHEIWYAVTRAKHGLCSVSILKETTMDEIDNLLLNMSGGLLPENLTVDEVSLLKDRYGDDWFAKLGYSELIYNKPKGN